MACFLDKDIINCNASRPIGGAETRIYAIARRNIVGYTIDTENGAIITALVLKSGTYAYRFVGYKSSNDAGFDFTQNDSMGNIYNQYVKIDQWGISSDDMDKVKLLDDLVLIVESKNKGFTGDGAFRIYGLTVGMYVDTHTERLNNNKGIATIEWRNQDGQYEGFPYRTFFSGSYEDSRDDLDDLLKPEGSIDWSSTLITFDSTIVDFSHI